MELNPLHESHIVKVAVSFEPTAPDLNPDEFSGILNIDPDDSAKAGGERRNYVGELLEPHKEGWWKLSTEDKLSSKDINDHFKYLLDRLLPHKDEILKLTANGETYFNVIWKSTYLYAGTGPVIEREIIRGTSELNAEIGFDIYQVDEKKSEA